MTDEHLNTLIAEHLGYTNVYIYKYRRCGENFWKNSSGNKVSIDFCSDYNLIIPLVRQLSTSQQVTYVNNLYALLGYHDHVEYEAVNATARQRAEAYLLTVKE